MHRSLSFGGHSHISDDEDGHHTHTLFKDLLWPSGSVVRRLIHIHVMSLKEELGRFFFHFREIFEKCIEYIGKFLNSFQGDLNFC